MVNKRECEVCGNEAYSLFERSIEGVTMYVCNNCKHMGKEPERKRRARIRATKRNAKAKKLSNMVSNKSKSYSSKPRTSYKKANLPYSNRGKIAQLRIVVDVSERLLKYRSKHGLSYKEFANSLFIKESYYKRIEKGTTALPIKLAKKIEKKYHIKLVEKEDYDDEDDYSQYNKENKEPAESMIYFKKRGKKPEYEQ